MKYFFIHLLPKSRFIKQTLALLAFAIMGASIPAGAQTNPYSAYLNSYIPYMNLPPMPTGSALTSTGDYIWDGFDLEMFAWGLTSSQSTLTTAQKTTEATNIQTVLTYLLNSTNDVSGHWWTSNSTISGDWNSDRFVLASVMQVLYQLQSHVTQINSLGTAGTNLTSNLAAWEATAKVAVNFQFNNYGQGSDPTYSSDWASPLAGHYPNQDADYAEIMGDAGLIYGNTTYNYTASAQAFVLDVKGLVQSGGTLPYCTLKVGTAAPYTYYTDGADIDYTDIVIGYLGLYLQDTSDPNAKATLVAMKGYFPKQLVDSGISEVSSSPWLKHSIAPLNSTPSPIEINSGLTSPGAVDTIAGLTSDPSNAYFAQTILAYSGLNGPNAGNNAIVGADFWQPITALPPSTNVMFPDYDINGVRGHFGAFNSVGVMNPGEDTCIGTTLAGSNFVQNASFSDGADLDYSTMVFAGSPTFALSTTVSHTGSNSEEITCAGSGNEGGVGPTDPWPVIPGHTYSFSVWYQTSSSLAAGAVICQGTMRCAEGTVLPWSLSWDTASTGATGALSGSALNLTATATSVGKWTQVTLTFVAPATSVTCSMDLCNWSGSGSVWYDDVSLTDLTSGIQPMAIDSTLELVSPEVGISGTSNTAALDQQAAYITPLTYPAATLVGANLDFSIVSSQYQPEQPSNATNVQYPTPPQAWQVNQTWLMLSDRVVGKVNMTSLTNHQDKYVRMRIRTAPGGLLQELTSSTFAASATNLTLLANDFSGVATGPAVTSDEYGAPDADEIFLTESGASNPATYTAGQSHTVALSVYPSTTDALDGYTSLTSGTLSGFLASEDMKQYYVWFNTGSSPAVLNYALYSGSTQTLVNLYVAGPGTTEITPSIITVNSEYTVNTTVPAYGIVCIENTRYLLPNPGFEQVSSGIPTGYTYESIAGSPTTAVDSTITPHGGLNTIKITGTGSAEGGIVAPPISIVQGKSYQVTFWYKSTLGSSAIVTRLTARGAGNTIVPWNTSWDVGHASGESASVNAAGQLVITASNSTPGTWNSATITFTLSSPTTTLGIECLNWLGNGSVWYDDLAVTQQ